MSDVVWQLAQVFWVGGVWVMHFGVLPVLSHIGLAALLVHDIGRQATAVLMAFAAACVAVQMVLLVLAQGVASLWRDVRGQLLIVAGLDCAAYFALQLWEPSAVRWQLFCYLGLGLTGLFLVLQPAPGRAREARR